MNDFAFVTVGQPLYADNLELLENVTSQSRASNLNKPLLQQTQTMSNESTMNIENTAQNVVTQDAGMRKCVVRIIG